MTTWDLHIKYGTKSYTIPATLEYHSAQIMRIRITGEKRSLLLENDYPLLKMGKNKRGMKWKIREGSFDGGGTKNAQLLTYILELLEFHIKKDFP